MLCNSAGEKIDREVSLRVVAKRRMHESHYAGCVIIIFHYFFRSRAHSLYIILAIYIDIHYITIHLYILGAVVVVNTMECLEWLEKVLNRHWIPTSDSSPPYRGMPLVILALDDSKNRNYCYIILLYIVGYTSHT